MKSWLLLCLSLLAAAPARAEGIVEVLQRSQQVRLAQRGAGDAQGEAGTRLRASFERLVAIASPGRPVELVVVGGDLFAEAVFGKPAVAASVAVGELPEPERLMLLAHELGHLQLGHFQALGALYASHIPGEVRQADTDRVAAALGAQAHALSHRHEFEADAYGYTLVHALGVGLDDAFALLTRQGVQADSATHPATRKRLAQIRLLDASGAPATAQGDGGEAIAALPPVPPPLPLQSRSFVAPSGH